MRSCPITSPVSRQRHRRHHSPLIMALQISIEKLKWGMQMLAVWADKGRGAASRSSSFSFLWGLWKSAEDYSEWRERVSPKPCAMAHFFFLCHQTLSVFCRRFHAWQFPTQTTNFFRVESCSAGEYKICSGLFYILPIQSFEPPADKTRYISSNKNLFWDMNFSCLRAPQ